MKNKQLIWGAVLGVVVLVVAAMSTVALQRSSAAQDAIQDLQTKQAVGDATAALSALRLNQPAVSVSDKKVYFPELKLALPLNDTSLSLLYSGRSTKDDGVYTYDLTTRELAALPTAGFQKELSCMPVRFSFETKANPYNQHEIAGREVKLADGRTLQIYAYANNVCNEQWDVAKVDPVAIADTLKQAVSYE